MANCYFRPQSAPSFFLVNIRNARPHHRIRSCVHHYCSTCQAWRCAFSSCRVGSAQTSTADLESFSRRAPNLRMRDRVIAGVCSLFLRPSRLARSAVVLKPSTLLKLHRILVKRKYRLLFLSTRKKPGPKGPSEELIRAVIEMKKRNPDWGCPRLANQIALAFGLSANATF